MTPEKNALSLRRASNLRTALVLASIALVFFAGTIFNHLLAQ